VYEAWKELVLALHRGYTDKGFEAWTIPCLYTAGKYLRVFAIKADAERAASNNDDSAAAFGDDFDPEEEKNKLQEDCARQLNRLFQLCLGDR
jgi:COP9 signalosome complex subunit 12